MPKAPPQQADHRPRYTGKISYTDMEALDIDSGAILVSGTSPNAKVTVLSFVGRKGRRGIQMDILKDCTVTANAKRATVTGTSYRAGSELGLRDGDEVVEIRVDLKHCADCGYA